MAEVYEYDSLIQARQTVDGVSSTVIIYPVTKWGNILDAPEVGDLTELATTDQSSIVAAINEIQSQAGSSGTTYITKQYRDVVYAETENQTEFVLTFPNWDPDTDFDMLTVVSGRLPLTPDEDYSVNGNVLTLVEGIESGRNLSLFLLRNEAATGAPTKLARLRQDLIATTESQTVFDITIEDFDSSTDFVTLTSGRTILTEDLDFTIAGNTLTLTEGVPVDRMLALYVYRNVNSVPITAYRNFMIEASDGRVYMLDVVNDNFQYTEIL